jgi:hypothetical protein
VLEIARLGLEVRGALAQRAEVEVELREVVGYRAATLVGGRLNRKRLEEGRDLALEHLHRARDG